MASVKLIAKANNGTGPFIYKLEAVNPCTAITLTDPNGGTGTNTIQYESVNQIVEFKAEFDNATCSGSSLATFKLTVTSDNGVCTEFIEVAKDNPCQNFTTTVSVSSLYNDADGNRCQDLTANVANGNAPFTYTWSIVSGNATLTNQSSNMIKLIRQDSDNTVLIDLTITDANGCSLTQRITLPPLDGNPVLQDFSTKLVCGQTSVVIDVVALASDADGTIDLNSITITNAPIVGGLSIDFAAGTITYTPGAATGVQDFNVTVQDNNGNTSNTALVAIQVTPCLDAPTGVADNFTTDCEVPTTINLIANDTDSDGTIVGNTLAIITNPLNGSVVNHGDGTVTYTPEAGFSGTDVFRYTVQDNDGNTSGITLVTMTVNPCCDQHSADIGIACTDTPDIQFTASNSGTITDVATDVMEVDTGSGYAAGTTGIVTVDCTEQEENFINDSFTNNVNGQFNSTIQSGLTVVPVSPGQVLIDFSFTTPMNPAMVALIQAFYNNCDGVIKFHQSSSELMWFLKSQITNFAFGSNGITFGYTVTNATGSCATEIDAHLNGAHTFFNNLAAQANLGPVNFTRVSCSRFGVAQNTVKFRRTITRSNGCPNVVIEKELAVTNISDACNNFTNTTLQAGGGIGAPSGLEDVEAVLNVTGAATITSVLVGATNILSTSYTLDNVGLVALDAALENYLAANGGGSVDIVLATNTLYVQIKDKQPGLNFVSVTANNGNTANFV